MAYTLLDLERIFSSIRRRLSLLEIQGNSGIVSTGLAVNRPSAPESLKKGITVTYYAYDTKQFFVWNIITETWDTVTLS